MPRLNEALVPVRMTPDLREEVAAFAERQGLRNDQGGPNMSAACVLLLSMGLEQSGVSGVVVQQALVVARSGVLREVMGVAREAFAEAARKMEEMD